MRILGLIDEIMNKKHRIVYRMDYALILQEKGHKVAGVMPNPQKPEYNTWIFECDDTLEDDLKLLIKQNRSLKYE